MTVHVSSSTTLQHCGSCKTVASGEVSETLEASGELGYQFPFLLLRTTALVELSISGAGESEKEQFALKVQARYSMELGAMYIRRGTEITCNSCKDTTFY